ncbi:MAG: hypothetical protein Q4G16_07655 [Cruoricaptor ignavus]|nr:hypothetical protein [Cruoricaptor ignavus]
MKKFLKYIFGAISLIISAGIIYFISKWSKISIDEHIQKSSEIKNLNKKIIDNTFRINKIKNVETDFSFFENNNDTVTFSININQNEKIPSLTLIHFNDGDGFSGVNINFIKYKNFSYSFIESYTDNIQPFKLLKRERYVLKKQKLTLNNSELKKGDSIWGKIELEILFTPTDSIFYSKGYFKSVVE